MKDKERGYEVKRNESLILLVQELIERDDQRSIDLLATMLANDTLSMKFTFKIISGINIIEEDELDSK